MANLFNAAEVIDMGIEKEKKRRDFYGLVAAPQEESNFVLLMSLRVHPKLSFPEKDRRVDRPEPRSPRDDKQRALASKSLYLLPHVSACWLADTQP